MLKMSVDSVEVIMVPWCATAQRSYMNGIYNSKGGRARIRVVGLCLLKRLQRTD
jgi:hypothetical protein